MGLVCFLRQAALSLDRVSAHDMTPLTEFYANKSRYAPGAVLTKLRSINHERCPANRFDQGQRPGVGDILKTLAQVFTFRKATIMDTRLCIAEVAVRQYEALLGDRGKWNQSDVNELRLHLSYTADLLVRQVHPRLAREATAAVYHLNHAEHLKLKEVEEIAGESWLLAD
jgi:hypothetical protein